jgi:hypothetical protein
MCRYISARKKLIHAMSLDIDQAINRPMVVGCAISATRNYPWLHFTRLPRCPLQYLRFPGMQTPAA